MSVTHVLAVVPVRDFDASVAWYESLFGFPPTNIPMPGILAEWRVTENGWVQMTVAAEHAGTALLNFAVDELEWHLAELESRGLRAGDVQVASKDVRLASIRDRDGNTITFIGNFREKY
jgi:catechol 2,3-dioxygenase-like lactoylglutathione lyase family enzyme